MNDAVSRCRQILASEPRHADSLHLFSVIALRAGQYGVAVDLLTRLVAIDGRFAPFHSNLGIALQQVGRMTEAIAAFRKAIDLKPDFPDAHYNLGNVLKDLGKRDEALIAYRNAAILAPGWDDAYFNRGVALDELSRNADAVPLYRRAIALNPGHLKARLNLGNALSRQKRLTDAIACYRDAAASQPDSVEARTNLGLAWLEAANLEEAQASLRKALDLRPDCANAYDALLMSLHYDPSFSGERILAESVRLSKPFDRAPMPGRHANDADPERRLRIGYVSADFRRHSVSYFLSRVFSRHSPRSTEIFCYSNSAQSDETTAILRNSVDHWREIAGLPDEAAASLVAADGIDILVDLSGHTTANRLQMFALKPAPVQATWLGYPGTTGLKAIDYRIVDAITDPETADGRDASETLIRLPGGFLCYAPAADAPEPKVTAPRQDGVITFGSFNNPVKSSAPAMDVWARILARVPASRLLLKGNAFADEAVRRHVHAALSERGIASDRVDLRGPVADPGEHLKTYDEIDIALDPFPYNGTTTTCEALWMGVPVITLLGERHSGRVGASLLTRLGLEELIARTADDYVGIAAALADDGERLAAMHRDLRQRMAASSLCDGASFTRTLEEGYRTMWRRWCGK